MVLAEHMALAEELENEWRSRLEAELPTSSPAVRESIVGWLIEKTGLATIT